MSHNPNNGNCPKTIVGDCGYEKCNPDVHPCTCEKQQQAPTSVTGDEWESEFSRFYSSQKGFEKHFPNLAEEQWVLFIRNLLSAQRTHIKQALLGRMPNKRGAFHDEGYSEGYDEAIDDIINILNEELTWNKTSSQS